MHLLVAERLAPPIGRLDALIAVGTKAESMALGIPPVCGEKATSVTRIRNIRKTATPLYSLLTRAILRFVFARVCGASFSKV